MPRIQRALIKGDMLRWARESMNLSPETAADRIGVKAEHLLACEAGSALLTINQLREAARVYRRPLAAFFLPEPPTDFYVPHDFRRVPGAKPRQLSPEVIAAVREAEYRRSLAIDFAEVMPEAPEHFIGAVSLNADVESMADNLRRSLGIPLEQQKSWQSSSRGEYEALNAWKNAVEHVGALVFHFSHVDVNEVRAFSISEKPFPVISVNGSDSPYGRVFSLLHELGHLLLQRGGTCNFREYEHVRSEDQQVEVFCNYLAGATLVPAEDLVRHPQVQKAHALSTWTDEQLAELAGTYHVSRQVVLRRLLIVGRTSRQFYRTKQDEFAKAGNGKGGGGFLTWPQKVVRTLGQPFLRIVLSAYYSEAITSSDLAEVIGVRLKHLPAIEERLAGPNVLTGSDT